MSTKHRVAAACAALILGGCGIGKPIPQATTYIIEPAAPVPSSEIRRGDSLRMGSVRVASAFAGNALVYRLDDVKYVSDPYHAFIADPGAMLGNRIAEWLDSAGPFKTVTQPGSAQSSTSARYVLEATVTELYGDMRTGARPAAVMTVQFTLLDTAEPRSVTVYARTMSYRVEIEQATPDALVRGYGTALSDILSQVRSDLTSLPPGQPAPKAQVPAVAPTPS